MASLAEVVEFQGMPAIRWRSRDGARAIATLQGAQLVSWIPAHGEECLYVSPRSPFKIGRPIRGGVPVAFPQFGDRGPLPQHGFARTLAWSLTGERESGPEAQVTFSVESTPQSLALWPGTFRLEIIATIGGPRLDVQLRVANTGPDAFAFTGALHTYFRISEAFTVRLEGLRGTRYVERGTSAGSTEPREMVTAVDPIDRVYLGAPPATRLRDAGRVLRIEQRGFNDTVVWNPGEERTAQMPDMPRDGFRQMLCVEAAAFEPQVLLNSGGVWDAGQSITVEASGMSTG
jgi:glucose-6-phosphate 1-epimerase